MKINQLGWITNIGKNDGKYFIFLKWNDILIFLFFFLENCKQV